MSGMNHVGPFPWNYRPSLPYLGKPRRTYGIYALSLHTVPKGGKRWTIAHQAWAVGQGFFVQLCTECVYDMGLGDGRKVYNMQRPVIHALDDCWTDPFAKYRVAQPVWHKISWVGAKETMRTIKRHAIEGDVDYLYLLEFITQQDEWGYHGAWDNQVKYWSRHLVWFKEFTARTKAKPTPLDEARLAQAARMRETGRKAGLKLHPGPKVWTDEEWAAHEAARRAGGLESLSAPDEGARAKASESERALDILAAKAVEERRARKGW